MGLLSPPCRAARAGSPRPATKGIALIYTACVMVALAGVTTLAVDLGRVQLVKSELQAAADAAARQAAANLHLGYVTAQSKAIAAAGYNNADGTPVVVQSGDAEFGLWDPATN